MKRVLVALLLVAGMATAQTTSTIPAKLFELDNVAQPAKTASWLPTMTYTGIGNTDSARVFFSNELINRTIWARVGGQLYVRAGYWGWFRVESNTVAEWNGIQETPAPEVDMQATMGRGGMGEMDAMDYTMIVAHAMGEAEVARATGAAVPRGFRLSHAPVLATTVLPVAE